MASKQMVTIQKLSQDYELVAASFHESGHAIAGLLNFMKITEISVNFKEKSVEGFTNYEMMNHQFLDQDIVNYINISEVYISYAGLVVEKMYYKYICGSDKFPMMLREGSSSDISAASNLIKKYNLSPPGKKRQVFKKQIFKELKIELSEYWEDIRLLSHILYKKKKINQEELKNILTKKSNNKEFWKNQFKVINTLVSDSSLDLSENEVRSILNLD